MKRILLIASLIAAALCSTPAGAARFNHTWTIASGTPIQLSAQQIFVKRIFIQAAPASSAGYICIMAGIPTGRTPACSNSSDLTAYLSPATATAPGGSYSDPNGAPGGQTIPDIDLSAVWIDGSHTGDTVVVSWEF